MVRGQWFVWTLGLACALCSGSFGDSLWGQKVVFTVLQCGRGYWQLAAACDVPTLEELSVCVALSRRIDSPQWTAFVYKQRGGVQVELGLGGAGPKLLAWLFGQEYQAPVELPHGGDWHQVCLTWSNRSRDLRIYVNGSAALDVQVNETAPGQPCCLPPNGSLTLGASHGYADGRFVEETGGNFLGELSLFRMWGHERGPQQLANLSCLEGDLVRWDSQDWDTHGCTPVRDTSQQCTWSLYEVQMTVCINHSASNMTHSAEGIVNDWLTATFPSNMSVLAVSASTSSSEAVSLGLRNTEQDKERTIFVDSSVEYRFGCLAYVRVTPSVDVGEAQAAIVSLLLVEYSNSVLNLSAERHSIRVTPVEALPSVTPSPPSNTTTLTSPISSTPSADPMVSTATVTPPIITASSTRTTADHTGTDGGQTSPGSGLHTSTVLPSTEATSGSAPTCSIRDTFYKVILNVTVNGSHPDPTKIIQTWLRDALEGEGMLVLNFVLESEPLSQLFPSLNQSSLEMNKTSVVRETSHGCSFQVQVSRSELSTRWTERQICDLLSKTYTSGTVSMRAEPDQINVTHIEPGSCPERVELTERGLYVWPQTEPQRLASQPCEEDPAEEATRLCAVGATTGKASWALSNLQLCPLVDVTISDLEKINVTAGNSEEVVGIIGSLVGNSKPLSLPDLLVVVGKLLEVVEASLLTSSLASDILTIIANILHSGSSLPDVTNEILGITDIIGDKLAFSGYSHNITAPSLAISLINVNPFQFDGLTFGVSSFSDGLDPRIFINEECLDSTVAFISLPREVERFFPEDEETQPRVQFHFYGTPDLFQDPGSGMDLYTYVVSASVTNATEVIKDLKHPVRVTLHHRTPNLRDDMVLCAYWNFQKNAHRGGWDTTGCERNSTSANLTTCLCYHLTHFAVLLDPFRTSLSEIHMRVLSGISYLGCGLSCVLLGISLLTYTAFQTLRRDYPSKILINLSVALIGLNLVFLVNSWLSSYSEGLCIAVAAILHYFTLASFSWMGLEAVHMYLALVKVFNTYVPSYMLKFCILGWGVPLITVSMVLAAEKNAYGNAVYKGRPGPTDENFCWVQTDVVFYVSVVTYILLILLCNITVFGLVLLQIWKMRINKPVGYHGGLLQDLRSVASLTFLLGLTWILAFFSWGSARVPLFYLFSILNSLQGFFIFLFHCLMKENVRKQWRVHLCCGRFRLSDYSDCSRSVTVGEKSKQNEIGHMPSVESDDSNETRRTSSSSSTGPWQPRNFQSRLDLLYKNEVTLPCASASSSPPPPADPFCLSPAHRFGT